MSTSVVFYKQKHHGNPCVSPTPFSPHLHFDSINPHSFAPRVKPLPLVVLPTYSHLFQVIHLLSSFQHASHQATSSGWHQRCCGHCRVSTLNTLRMPLMHVIAHYTVVQSHYPMSTSCTTLLRGTDAGLEFPGTNPCVAPCQRSSSPYLLRPLLRLSTLLAKGRLPPLASKL